MTLLQKDMSAVLQTGRNCWRIEKVNRFALLVDGADYYTALAKAIRRAKRWIALLAWDLDTRTHLVEHDPFKAIVVTSENSLASFASHDQGCR